MPKLRSCCTLKGGSHGKEIQVPCRPHWIHPARALANWNPALASTQPLSWSQRLHVLNIRAGLTGPTSRNWPTSIRRHWQSTTLSAPCRRLHHTPARRCMCHLRSAELQTQGLIKFQFRDRLCVRTCEVRPQIMTRFRRQVCPLFSSLRLLPLASLRKFFLPAAGMHEFTWVDTTSSPRLAWRLAASHTKCNTYLEIMICTSRLRPPDFSIRRSFRNIGRALSRECGSEVRASSSCAAMAGPHCRRSVQT